ncbi:MAG: hypothetical protein NVS9B4_25580 [Candidatus Acidiferrum sp.]
MMQSSPFNVRRLAMWIGRLVLGGIFIYAGYSKAFYPNLILSPMFALRFSISANLSNFAQQVAAFQLLSPSGAALVGQILPFVEITLGVLLLIGWQLRVWAAVASVLLIGFLSVVSRAYMLHMDINCGCFAKPEPLTGWTVLRDAFLAAVAIVTAVFAYIESRRPHPWSEPGSPGPTVESAPKKQTA